MNKISFEVPHLSIKENWDLDQVIIKKPEIIVLGSFNPYIPNNAEQVDFYCGRISKRGPGNFFWKTIGKLKYHDEKYFENNKVRKLEEMNNSKFIFFDLINFIKISSKNENHLQNYLNNKVYKNFGDNDIWVIKTMDITLERKYNNHLIDFLNTKNTITKIINTLGTKNGPLNFNHRDQEWVNYKDQLLNICLRKNIKVISESISPSPQSVNRVGFEKYDEWIMKNIYS